jgi:ribokinase
VLLTFEPPVPTIGAARSCGAPVFAQPAPVLAEPLGAALIPWDQVDLLVPNEIEALALFAVGADLPVESPTAALAVELSVPNVVVTLGEAEVLPI